MVSGSWSTGRTLNVGPVVAGLDAASDLAEVGPADVLVGGEALGRVGQDHAPGLEHVAAMGDMERLQRVLLDEQDRRARAR